MITNVLNMFLDLVDDPREAVSLNSIESLSLFSSELDQLLKIDHVFAISLLSKISSHIASLQQNIGNLRGFSSSTL